MNPPTPQELLDAAQAAGTYTPPIPDPPWWATTFTLEHAMGCAAVLLVLLFVLSMSKPGRWYRNPLDWALDIWDGVWPHLKFCLIFVALGVPAFALMLMFGSAPCLIYAAIIAAWGWTINARRRRR